MSSGSRPPARIHWFQQPLDQSTESIQSANSIAQSVSDALIGTQAEQLSEISSQSPQRLTGARESISAQLNSTLSTLLFQPRGPFSKVRLLCRAENPSTGAFLQDIRDLTVQCK